MTFDWHPRQHRKALEGMQALPLEERGAYNTILDLIYDRGSPIPDDARWLAGWMSVTVKRWRLLRAALIYRGKIYELNYNGEPALMNRRAAIEIDRQAKLRRKLSENGAKGAQIRAERDASASKNNELVSAPAEAPLQLKTGTGEEQEAKASLSPVSDEAPKYPELFELAWTAYRHVRGRSSKSKAHGFWRRIPQAHRQALPSACVRYGREGREPNGECGAPGMHRWLQDGRYLDWLEELTASPVLPVTPEALAQRVQHYRDTGEWRESWGPPPEVGADLIPFPSDRRVSG